MTVLDRSIRICVDREFLVNCCFCVLPNLLRRWRDLLVSQSVGVCVAVSLAAIGISTALGDCSDVSEPLPSHLLIIEICACSGPCVSSTPILSRGLAS